MDYSDFLNIHFFSAIVLPVVAIVIAIWTSYSTSRMATKQISAITDVCRLQVETMIIQVEQHLVDLESEEIICKHKLHALQYNINLTPEEKETKINLERELKLIQRKKAFCYNHQNALLRDQNILNNRK